MRNVNARQLEVLSTIASLVRFKGYPPGIRELADAIGSSSTNAASSHVEALIKKGCLRRHGPNGRHAHARNLRITDDGYRILRERVGSGAEERPEARLI